MNYYKYDSKNNEHSVLIMADTQNEADKIYKEDIDDQTDVSRLTSNKITHEEALVSYIISAHDKSHELSDDVEFCKQSMKGGYHGVLVVNSNLE